MPDLRSVPAPADLLDAPERALDLSPAEATAMLARVEGLAAVLRLRAAAPAGNGREAEPPDDMLTVPEAAQRAGVSVAQFYRRRALFRPAIVKLGHRTIRVNGTKLLLILARR